MAQNELHLGMVTSLRLQDHEIVVTVGGQIQGICFNMSFSEIQKEVSPKRCDLVDQIYLYFKYQICIIPKYS